jgi:hypothetical protein
MTVFTVIAVLLPLSAYSFMFASAVKQRPKFLKRSRRISAVQNAPENSLVFINPHTSYGQYLISNPQGLKSDPVTVNILPGQNKTIIEFFKDRSCYCYAEKDDCCFLTPLKSDFEYYIDASAGSFASFTGNNIWINEHTVKIAVAQNDKAGWFAFGRKARVFPGKFIAVYNISITNTPDSQSSVVLDVAADSGQTVIAKKEVKGNIDSTLNLEFEVDDFCLVEPRIYYNGVGKVVLKSVKIVEQ